MIRKWFIPKLIELGIKDRVWLQQDGAPAHFALPVRALLNAEFPDRWIGRGSNSFAWPPRSPDLTTPDNSLWGFIKGQVSGIRYETIDQLKHAIIAAFASVSRNSLQKMAQRTWRRMELCKNNEGQHTDPLDHKITLVVFCFVSNKVLFFVEYIRLCVFNKKILCFTKNTCIVSWDFSATQNTCIVSWDFSATQNTCIVSWDFSATLYTYL